MIGMMLWAFQSSYQGSPSQVYGVKHRAKDRGR
jgi:hypothetical protein